MTIDEAIKHCEEIARTCDISNECRENHHQLALWLKELKILRQKFGKMKIAQTQPTKKYIREGGLCQWWDECVKDGNLNDWVNRLFDDGPNVYPRQKKKTSILG